VNFSVEIDSDELLTTAVDLLLDKVGADAGLTDLLVRFIESRLDEEQDWNIERILLDFARILLDEEGSSQQLGKLKDISLEDFSKIPGNLLKKRIAVFEQEHNLSFRQSLSLNMMHQVYRHRRFTRGDHGISAGTSLKLAQWQILGILLSLTPT
jgi:hypothetical protein